MGIAPNACEHDNLRTVGYRPKAFTFDVYLRSSPDISDDMINCWEKISKTSLRGGII